MCVHLYVSHLLYNNAFILKARRMSLLRPGVVKQLTHSLILKDLHPVVCFSSSNVHSYAAGKSITISCSVTPLHAVNLFHVGKQYLSFCKAKAA